MPTVFLEFLGYGYTALLLFLTTEVLSYSSVRELYFLNVIVKFFLPLFRKVAQNRRAQSQKGSVQVFSCSGVLVEDRTIFTFQRQHVFSRMKTE